MSKKYAGIHIYSDNTEEVLSALKDIIAKQNSDADKNMLAAVNVFKDPEIRNRFKRLQAFMCPKTLVVLHGKFISVYNDSYSFETINNTAKKISKKIDDPIIYAANFLDVIFLIGFVKDGKTPAKRNIGEMTEEYGLTAKSSIKKFHTIKEFECFNKTYEFETSEDIEICESSVEKTFNIILKLSADQIESDTDNFKLIDDNSIFSVYVRI